MEMIINAEKVIAERKIRAWSQQHLADASAVSLRTIQRVENNGSGSLETIKALASCFELNVDMLFEPKVEVINKKPKSKAKTKPKIVVFCSFILALLSSVLFIVPTSMASNLTISAESIKTNTHEGYSIYNKNVVIFLPKGMSHKVVIDSNWKTNSSSPSSGGINIYLEHSVISIGKASITTTESGTKITTEYAKLSVLY
ncbi:MULTISPECIES: helix-turn-helix transcriptional regulator [unclassified Colwellia]|uniref:helix-turn-helix transcriptional regulator n=1 Tax=unclassified Colwellia TaxID=196834 RepID=UPI0015F3D591|nr:MULTISPECIES: helix-turn-helix transcriptional regulator [unclassified Colwellia]MBA6232867.1 helix-turn-helix transcriptional regulator [Colwellia sp. MB02u-7]MBA6237001.1 helix-turn-helix transcriptional regulator [Colwellia sp. MB02u-11]MBA6258213.1 helix-turn-helix transcriptional regulator [Colwellia sp. MB3u-28]MBA6259640.1 helix-turn-helix transcriptional regulator [Colwellia sp. MB3u-41]MBA6299520.1 helix-turn-helix transcriptional regulator [Colwellia sp. MB3u-22]